MLQDVVATLTIPGLPGWSGLVVLVLLALVGLAYLLMPFSVFGLKARLEAVEAQLDEIQAELRSLTQRMPEQTRRRSPVENDWAEPVHPTRGAPEGTTPRLQPPIIPPAAWPERGSGRSEPRLDWPRHP